MKDFRKRYLDHKKLTLVDGSRNLVLLAVIAVPLLVLFPVKAVVDDYQYYKGYYTLLGLRHAIYQATDFSNGYKDLSMEQLLEKKVLPPSLMSSTGGLRREQIPWNSEWLVSPSQTGWQFDIRIYGQNKAEYLNNLTRELGYRSSCRHLECERRKIGRWGDNDVWHHRFE